MKLYIIIGMFLVASMISGGVYYYYTTTQATIQRLIQNNVQLEENLRTAQRANEENVETIRQLQESYQQVQENFTKLNNDFQTVRNNNNLLRDRLGKYDLGALAYEKPLSIERAVNNGTINVMRCFEVLSGSQPNQVELNADSPKSANKECPWIFEKMFETNAQ